MRTATQRIVGEAIDFVAEVGKRSNVPTLAVASVVVDGAPAFDYGGYGGNQDYVVLSVGFIEAFLKGLSDDDRPAYAEWVRRSVCRICEEQGAGGVHE